MLLSEAVMFGTMLADPLDQLPFVEMALRGEERPSVTPGGGLAEFLHIWPWTSGGQSVGPQWSRRRMTLASPLENFSAIWDQEVRTGRVPVEKFVAWIRLFEEYTDESWISP